MKLPKGLSKEAYRRAKCMSYEGFTEWWDSQVLEFSLVPLTNIEIIQNEKPKFKSLYNVELGDLVECIRVLTSQKKTLTKGKKYEVVRLDEEGWYTDVFYIRNDRGKIAHFKKSNHNFKVVV